MFFSLQYHILNKISRAVKGICVQTFSTFWASFSLQFHGTILLIYFIAHKPSLKSEVIYCAPARFKIFLI